MSRHVDVGRRGHGPCRVLFHADIDGTGKPLPELSPIKAAIEKHKLWATNREAMRAIDRDYRRGGFSPDMRHAR